MTCRKKNIIFVILACSLLLNAFLAGRLMSSHHRDNNDHFGPPSPLQHMEQAADKLDEKDRVQIHKLIDEHKVEFDADFQKMDKVVNDIHPVLTAPVFDAKKLKQMHDRLYKYDDHIKQGMLDLLIKIAKALPDEGRIKFFNEIKPPHHGFHDGGPGGFHNHGEGAEGPSPGNDGPGKDN